MIALFSDFSISDPYVGLMKLEIYKHAPNANILDICHEMPAFNPNAAGCLLRALVKNLPEDTIVLAVVDPGVGTDRRALWLEIDGKHFVGPDNGLFARIVNQANEVNAHVIEYENEKVSASFHGRDVFAPFAAGLENGLRPRTKIISAETLIGRSWQSELTEVIYIDHYGNAITGISASSVTQNSLISVKDTNLRYTRTFGEEKEGICFWYKNSVGLIELSMSRASIAAELELGIGEKLSIIH